MVARGRKDHWEVMTMVLEGSKDQEEEAMDSTSPQPGQIMTNQFLDRGCRMCKVFPSPLKIKASLG